MKRRKVNHFEGDARSKRRKSGDLYSSAADRPPSRQNSRIRARRIRAFVFASAYPSPMEATKPSALDTLSRALAALRENRLGDAEDLSRELLRISPRDPAAHQLAATVALQQGAHVEAGVWARSCLALRPNHAPAMMIAGSAGLASGDVTSAKTLFRRASELSADDPKPLFQLGLAQIESSDSQAAATIAELTQRFPAEASGWRDIGLALMRADDLDAAEAAFGRAAGASGDPSHSVNLGRLLLARGRAAEAIAPFRHALAATPDRPEALLLLGQALRQIGAPREALQQLIRLAELQPAKGSVFYALGLVYDDLRNWSGAIAAYGRCVELSPEMPEAHVNLGLALQQIGELARAISCYRRAMRLRPDTFGRIVQALPSTQKGMLWLDPRKLRDSLVG
jgi:tetratricopeptide (TPR) repeat protein